MIKKGMKVKILTGKDKGPELKNFLPLLDKQTLLRKFGKT